MNDDDKPKSMELFFIDNQCAFGKGAKLLGDYVVWVDDGYFPSFAPVSLATHPNFNGKVVVTAGNRGIVVTFCKGATDQADVRRIMSLKDRPEQYRIAIDAIVHRLVLAGAGSDRDLSPEVGHHGQGVEPLALMAWLVRSAPKEAMVIAAALDAYLRQPAMNPLPLPDNQQLPVQEAYELAESLLVTLNEVNRSG